MSRWSVDDVADYVGRRLDARPIPAILVRPPPAHDHFTLLLSAAGCPPATLEHQFHPHRKWRLDFAWPELKVGVEVEGGIWSKGRAKAAHGLPLGILRDMEKGNALVMLGWRVLRYTPDQLERAVPEIAQLVIHGGTPWHSGSTPPSAGAPAITTAPAAPKPATPASPATPARSRRGCSTAGAATPISRRRNGR